MTFVHIGQVVQMKQSRGLNIFCQDTNHTKEEQEAKLIRQHLVEWCKSCGYNVIDVKQHNKKGMELID